jgi:hypothetical protein
MKKRSGMIIAAALVSALMAGMVSRDLTINHAAAVAAGAKPVAVVAQAAQAPRSVAYGDDGGGSRDG